VRWIWMAPRRMDVVPMQTSLVFFLSSFCCLILRCKRAYLMQGGDERCILN
jgi:hypothetical protein